MFHRLFWDVFTALAISRVVGSSADWFNCGRKENACTSLECSAMDAAIRSQIMCAEFPYYSGGLSLFRYESLWSNVATFTGRCQHASMNSTSTPYCDVWTTSPMNTPSDQMSECHCTDEINEIITNASHTSCQSWMCDDTLSTTTKYECTSQQLNDTQNVYFSEFARYSSVDDDHSSSFCWQWSGDTIESDGDTSESEWAVSSCQCDTPHILQVNDSGVNRVVNAYCETWTCFQKTMAYHRIPALHFHLSWSVAAVVGILLFIAIYVLLKCIAKPKYCKHARILKVALIAALLICLLALLLAAFESGGALSVFVTMFIWLLCVIATVLFIAVVRFVEKKRSNALQKAQQEFAKQREQYLQQKFTTKNLFRLSMVESENEFEMDI